MRVLLSNAQIERILARTVLTDAHRHFCWWLERQHDPFNARQLSVLMPPDAWRWVRDLLIDFTIHPSGSRRQVPSRTSAWHTLTRTVVQAVNARQAHPGLRGQFAVGVHEEILPAWGQHGFASLAEPDDVFRILVPFQRKVAGDLIITGWSAGKPTYDLALEEEAHHLLFCRPVDAVTRRPDGRP